ncbi:hypothetical protein ACROYT_G013772 [Oculina patagonica]
MQILDACAAPGSKTVQLIELLHDEESSQVPDGLVVANELQNKRCYMLVHQSKRLHSPCCLITNHDAALFPTLFVKGEDDKKMPLIFDRILCDVPCSGDGTLRKNPVIWRKWTPQLGLSLFRIQLRILARAVEMLATGGRIVYSTCTLNPVEDEAVICTLLQKAEGAIELVDVSSHLPNLKRSPGLKTWKVMTKDMTIVDNCDPGTEYYSKGFKPEMLAPSEEVVNKLHLERCMRIYPHQQDTGGFFIAVLEKKFQAPWENGKRCSNNPRLLPWESMADWQKKKEEKYKKKDTESTLLTGDEIANHCKSEEGTTTIEKAAASSQGNATCDEVTNSADKDLDEFDEQDAHSNVYGEEDDKANKLSNDEQHSSSENLELEKASSQNESANDNDTTGEPAQQVQPPRKKAKVEMKGFKEDPFVFIEADDEHWPLIKKFYGIDECFPANQLMVRSVAGKKRNIYLVSKAVKEVMEMIDDNHKVVNTGMKVIARADADNVGCDFRLMQEGIEAMLPFISKRKVILSQKDVVILLTHDRPFINEFSSGTREQLNDIEEQGCIVYIYEPNGPYSCPEDTIGCRIVFCGWKAKVSTRVQISKFDKAHYQVLCGIPPEEKQKGRKRALQTEGEAECKEDEVTQPNDDEQQAGFLGDILNLEAPEGSLDVGFI